MESMTNNMNNNQLQSDAEVQQALNPDQNMSQTMAGSQSGQSMGDDYAKDPVCGMMVEKATAQNTLSSPVNADMGTLYFCSPSCKALFEENPSRYGYPNF